MQCLLHQVRHTTPGFDRSRNKKQSRRGKKCENSASGARCERKVPPGPAHRVSATVTET